jgi:hypothetical protein
MVATNVLPEQGQAIDYGRTLVIASRKPNKPLKQEREWEWKES